MNDHMQPSFWGMAFGNGGPFLFAVLMSIAIGMDPMTMLVG